MANRKIELVSFELHNYCTKQDNQEGFVCEDVQCEGCDYNKKYLLAADGRGIDAELLAEEYEIHQYMAQNRYFIRLKSKQQRSWGWVLALLLLFGIAFGAAYFVAVMYLL